MLSPAARLFVPADAVSQVGSVSNPIVPGDHPDPTILRLGSTYWMASTSGDWIPSFSLFRSTDLSHWTAAGAVFPQPPAWASGDFWAPELTSGPDGIYAFYAARKKDGPLCVAVADAPNPDGPYTDHGPLICQPDGSIDPSVVRDRNGRPFLVWKEDGNSIKKPTIIWAQPLTSDLLHLSGTRFELIRNNPDSWEGAVVEGPYILHHNGWFYLFYAGNACCGVTCHYAEGVARARRLTGPWTKDPANPIIRPNRAWLCPGHGTAVTTPSGKDYFLYHAYPAAASVYLGRESVLDAIHWSPKGWPIVNHGTGPSGDAEANLPPLDQENFQDAELDPEWKWPIGHRPVFKAGDGVLTIAAAGEGQPIYLAHSAPSLDYEATVGVPERTDAAAGLGLVGETTRAVTVFRQGAQVLLVRKEGPAQQVVAQANVAATGTVWLRISASANHQAGFSYSTDKQHWTQLNQKVEPGGMLAWDHGLRISLVADGPAGTRARFVSFTLRSLPATP
jgi:beta-xylosidase